jgi:predicted ATP-binding protein involved in virulence
VIVKTFKAKKVFGYLDFDIRFNNDISFLVGGNGSGKTTALKLMNALVNPNFKDLLQIPFEKVALVVEEEKDLIEILAEEQADKKILKISSLDAELSLPSYSNVEFEYYSHKSEKLEEFIDEINRKFSDHEIVKKISEIQSPVFLGLDRGGETGYRDDYYFEREMRLRTTNKRAIAAKRLIRGSLSPSLMETEFLVQNAYKRLRQLEDHQSTKLRDSILLSAFQYSDFDAENLKSDMSRWKEKTGLLQRQKEIKEALSKIGVKDSKLSTEVDKFFSQLTSLFEQLSETQGEQPLSETQGEQPPLALLLNKAQIERISKIIEIIDEHKSKVDNFFKPINDFLSTVNGFYKDSDKKLEINTVGQLIVKRPDDNKCTIEGLSSGERQLLVIFAHAFLNRYNKGETTFIIDEPELSLHLGWQEKFAETILSISPKSQFILATHSPDIIGVHKNKAVGCR